MPEETETKNPALQRLDILLAGRPAYTWARQIGWSQAGMARLVKKGTWPGPEKLLGAMAMENVSLNWLIAGQGQPYIVIMPPSARPDRITRIAEGATQCWVLHHDGGSPAVVFEWDDAEVTIPASKNHESVHLKFTAGAVMGWLMTGADLDAIEQLPADRNMVMLPTHDVMRLIRGQSSWREVREKLVESDSLTARLSTNEPSATYGTESEGPAGEPDWWHELSGQERRALMGFVDVLLDRKRE